MKEKLKKQIGVIWAVIFLVTLGIQGSGIMAQAATSVSCVPITCYTISTGRVNTYSLSNGRYTYTGYISGSTDKCVIQQVRTDGYCKVKYPVSRGYKTAYAQSAQFFVNTDFSLNTVRLGDRKTVYRRSNLSQTLGTVYADDNVIIIGTSGNATQIIYPVSGGYKMGFVSGHYSSSGEQQANISDGYYQIISALNKDYVLDVYGGFMDDEANVQLYKNQRSINQGFLIRKQSDGYYTIAAIHSNKLLDVYKNQMFNGANIIQFSPTGGDNQKWKIVKTQDGYYSIISKSNGLYMDVRGGEVGNEVNVWCYSGNGTMAQKFILQSVTVGGKAYQGEGQQSGTETHDTVGFQMPLTGARCSWRSSSNWSWGENVNGGGYSSSRVYHLGADLIGSSDNVYATANGTVVRSGWNNANGNYVVIQHSISGKTIYSFYAHLSSRSVSQGTSVSKGQKIGVVGNTGSSSRGKHLHFAMMDTLWNGSYYGYSTYFTGNKVYYQGVTYYNPIYIVQNGRLP